VVLLIHNNNHLPILHNNLSLDLILVHHNLDTHLSNLDTYPSSLDILLNSLDILSNNLDILSNNLDILSNNLDIHHLIKLTMAFAQLQTITA